MSRCLYHCVLNDLAHGLANQLNIQFHHNIPKLNLCIWHLAPNNSIGYWRNAWKVDYSCLTRNNNTHISKCNETVVLKTLKFQHNFEESHYEHNRIDAMAMERLTSSPRVINIFGACGNSVITEFADGERVGALADKKKKKPLERLKIALDIARGLVALHSIDGDEEATFVHFDVNLANVVSIGGRLKLNDFNIGVILKRNETSGKACGFPAKYPNPQVRYCYFSSLFCLSQAILVLSIDIFCSE